MLSRERKYRRYTVKKVSCFPVQSRDPHVTNQTLPDGEYLSNFLARESLVDDIPAGDGKTAKLFLQCSWLYIVVLNNRNLKINAPVSFLFTEIVISKIIIRLFKKNIR
jgi:hypothetical protein